MTEERIPHSWVGKEVEVGLAVPAGFHPKTLTPHPTAGVWKIGLLEDVTDLGIVGKFQSAMDDLSKEPESRFYPWSAVLSIGSPEDPDVAEVRPIR